MLDGQVKLTPTAGNDGPVPCNGYTYGRPVGHVYKLTGWRPDPGLWISTLSQLP